MFFPPWFRLPERNHFFKSIILNLFLFALTFPECFRGRVNGDENEIRLLNGLGDLRGEDQVLATTFLHNLIQTRLVDRKVVRVPFLKGRKKKRSSN